MRVSSKHAVIVQEGSTSTLFKAGYKCTLREDNYRVWNEVTRMVSNVKEMADALESSTSETFVNVKSFVESALVCYLACCRYLQERN